MYCTRTQTLHSLFTGLFFAPEEAQGAEEEVRSRVEKGMRGHSGVARAQDPEVLFH